MAQRAEADFGDLPDDADFSPQPLERVDFQPRQLTPVIPAEDLELMATATQRSPIPRSPQAEMDDPRVRAALAEKLMRAAEAVRDPEMVRGQPHRPTAAAAVDDYLHEDVDAYDDGYADDEIEDEEFVRQNLHDMYGRIRELRRMVVRIEKGLASFIRELG